MRGRLNNRWIWAWIFAATVTASAVAIITERAEAQPPPAANPGGSYTLLHGSYLIDDCPPCARPTILEPMRGTFDLRLVEENSLVSRYELTNIAFTAGAIAGRTYRGLFTTRTFVVHEHQARTHHFDLQILFSGRARSVCRRCKRRWRFAKWRAAPLSAAA